MAGRGRKHVSVLMSSNGDGTGTVEAIGDYSVTPLSLKLKLDDHSKVEIYGLKMKLRDIGTFQADDYASLTGSLTNGIRIYVRDGDDELIEELTSYPIKNNADLATFTNFRFNDFATNDNVMSVGWDISGIGTPVKLDFSKGQYLEVFFNDDFTGITEQTFAAFGHYPHEYYP